MKLYPVSKLAAWAPEPMKAKVEVKAKAEATQTSTSFAPSSCSPKWNSVASWTSLDKLGRAPARPNQGNRRLPVYSVSTTFLENLCPSAVSVQK